MKLVSLADIKLDEHNANKGTERGLGMLEKSLKEYGAGRSILLDKNHSVIAGNKTLEQWAALGYDQILLVPSQGDYLVGVVREDLDLGSDSKARGLAYADNRVAEVDLDWNVEQLLEDMEAGVEIGEFFFENELEDILGDLMPEVEKPPVRPSLADRFVVPPFSVLDARQGYWQERKREWLQLGIHSEVGRAGGANALPSTFARSTQAQQVDTRLAMDKATSIFDPVLCELAYRWFSPPRGRILDPFAGGSVRGVVAATLGRQYVGVELREEQIAANRDQAAALDISPTWINGDARNIGNLALGAFDFLFSCPPYYDLEVYSDLPGELSAMQSYEDFLRAYGEIVKKATGLLEQDRFACFVVGDIRDKKGHYRNFVSDTIRAFLDAELELYNEAILITPAGTVMMQTSRNFPVGRKLGKTHQNVLVFVKGDWRKAVEACGAIEVVDMGLEPRLMSHFRGDNGD